MTWTLDPDAYTCPQHGVDLTERVLVKVTTPDIVLLDSVAAADAYERFDPRGRFSTIVECPGRERGRKPATAHTWEFEGVVR